MSDQKVARVNKDKAGSLIQTGAKSVFTNGDASKWWTATEGSTIKGPPNVGDTIVSSDVTVFAENKKVAVEGAITARGFHVGPSSPNVFAGNLGPGEITVIENDDVDDGTPEGRAKAITNLQTWVAKGYISQDTVKQVLNQAAPADLPSATDATVAVLMFRGLDPTRTSGAVDNTGTKIIALPGYRVVVANWENWKSVFATVQPDEAVILYGFSKGGESVQSILSAYPNRAIKAAITIDPYWTVTQKWGSGIFKNVERVYNWYNPNWGYNKEHIPNGVNSPSNVQQNLLPEAPTGANHASMPQRVEAQVLAIIQGIKPTGKPVGAVTSGRNPSGRQGTGTPMYNAGSQNLDMTISKHFKLKHFLTREQVNGKPFNECATHPLADRGFGVTPDFVIQNLSLWAQNIADPLFEKYPDMFFSSTQRDWSDGTGTPNYNSQHPGGQACDIKFAGGNRFDQQIVRVQWIFDNLPFDQLLLERLASHRDSFWIHCSYTAPNMPRVKPGGRKGPLPVNDPNKYGTLLQHVWVAKRAFIRA